LTGEFKQLNKSSLKRINKAELPRNVGLDVDDIWAEEIALFRSVNLYAFARLRSIWPAQSDTKKCMCDQKYFSKHIFHTT